MLFLLGVDVYTSSGTHNKRSNATVQHVWVVGGGGGGAGAAMGSGGAGGGGGGAAFKVINAPESSATVTIGAGGGGGSAGANPGSSGGTSSFNDGTISVSAGGGSAGASGVNAPGNGGSGSGGDVNLTGEGGDSAFGATQTGGHGGSSPGMFLGGGGRSINNTTSDAGGNYGGGGGGASGANEARAGGDGFDGIVVVYEFTDEQTAESEIEFTDEAFGRVGTLRATQQYISVLTERVTEIDVDAESTITFDSTAFIPEIDAEATSTVTFTHEAEGELDALRVESEIVFGQEAVADIDREAESTITFDSFAFIPEIDANAESEIVFGQSAELQFEAGNTITFGQSAQVERDIPVESTIEFTDEAISLYIDRSVEHTITFEQEATRPVMASNTVVFEDVAEPEQPDASEFSQSEIVFGQTAVGISDLTLEVTSEVVFGQGTTYDVDKSGVECLYTPFIGDGEGDAPSATLRDPDVPAHTKGIQLRYPVGSPTDSVVLDRSMSLGDTDRLTIERIERESRGGTLIVSAGDQWPTFETLLFEVAGICTDDAEPILAFIQDYLGREIELLTHEGQLWRGVIMNPQGFLTQTGRDSYTIAIEFEGYQE